MEISLPRLPEPITFRFFADFNIQIQLKEIAGFTTQQNSALPPKLLSLPIQAHWLHQGLNCQRSFGTPP
jgi:hypothetical protein